MREKIIGWYQEYLGRTPSDDEIRTWWQHGDDAEMYIAMSPEAEAYRARSTGNTTPPAPGSSTATQEGAITPSGTNTHGAEGFNTGREQNTGKSAKDAFLTLANQAPPPPAFADGMTKADHEAALEAWFNQYIKAGMDALGHKVLEVKGDKFRFANWQGSGQEFGDFYRGAGAHGGALQWGFGTPAPAGASYTPFKPPAPLPPVPGGGQLPPDEGLPPPAPIPQTPPDPSDRSPGSMSLGAMMAPPSPFIGSDRTLGDLAQPRPVSPGMPGVPDDTILMSELARQRAARLRGLRAPRAV